MTLTPSQHPRSPWEHEMQGWENMDDEKFFGKKWTKYDEQKTKHGGVSKNTMENYRLWRRDILGGQNKILFQEQMKDN